MMKLAVKDMGVLKMDKTLVTQAREIFCEERELVGGYVSSIVCARWKGW